MNDEVMVLIGTREAAQWQKVSREVYTAAVDTDWARIARESNDLLREIYKVATGEIQVANNDTEALAVIARWIHPDASDLLAEIAKLKARLHP